MFFHDEIAIKHDVNKDSYVVTMKIILKSRQEKHDIATKSLPIVINDVKQKDLKTQSASYIIVTGMEKLYQILSQTLQKAFGCNVNHLIYNFLKRF